MQKLRYTANFGTGLTTIFTGTGYRLEADCVATGTVTARSTASDGLASASRFSGNTTATVIDPDFDTNDPVPLSQPGANGNSVFAFSGAAGNVASANLVSFFGLGSAPQGNCVVAGTLETAA